ncbi:MAG: MMPL family transporter [Sediminibacterium sp.]|nr:MMPL family transporter [Sediminibacterium sp.]
MLKRLADFILKYRLILILSIAIITAIMGFFASKIEITYHFAKLLPDNDSTSIAYESFKKRFGQDGTILVVGIKKDALHTLDNYKAWTALGDSIKGLAGIKSVVSVARLNDLVLNDTLGKFEFKPLAGINPTTQDELDDLMYRLQSLKFYEGFIYNSKTNSTIMAVTFYEKDVNSKRRLEIVDDIYRVVNHFSERTGIDTHFSGLPYIRTTVMRKIRDEMSFFLGVALIVTAVLLFVFFRSFAPVIFSLLVVACGVITSLGLIVLFGFKISVLSGLIPPLIIVIGVPNCILILNKYHTELVLGIPKDEALNLSIQRSTASLFFANITTSIGFAVFCAIQNKLFFEFGLVSSLSVMLTYVFSIVLVPSIFSYLKQPPQKHLNHLDASRLRLILDKVALITQNHRKAIYVIIGVLSVICLTGLLRIRAFGFVVDDIPKKDVLIQDLKYFEQNFGGVLPFEITIDTKKENGVFANNARTLYKINRAQKMLASYKELSRPLSVVEGVKFLYQSYKGGEAKYYKLPPATDLKNIAEYVKTEKEKQSQLSVFIDSTKRYTRIAVQIADVGSTRVNELTSEIRPRIDSIFNYDEDTKTWASPEERYDVQLTGNCIVFLKGSEFLVNNLIESVVLAIILIAVFMLTLFTSFRMILISTIPSLVALLITAGLMGFLNIPLKPSTILVFSIAFGISSDGTLYFLTKYRHEIKVSKLGIGEAVRLTIRETGVSMIYTAIVLFFGFGMFALSGFGGTQALGILISFTLIIAYCSNLILLPAFLLSLEKKLTDKTFIEAPQLVEDEQILDEPLNLDEDTSSKT